MFSLNLTAVQLVFTVVYRHCFDPSDPGPQVCHWSLLSTIPVLKGEGYQLSLQVVTDE